MSWLVKLPLIILSLAALSFLFISLAVLHQTLHFPPRSKITSFPPDFDPASEGFLLQKFNLQPEPGVRVAGFILQDAGTDRSLPTVILIHGVSSRKESFAHSALSLARRGFRAVAFDLRAHGESSGACTYGWKEKRDLSQIIDLVRNLDPASPVGIYGNSLGGAVGLQAMAADPRIQCAVVESTFADFPQAACLRSAGWLGIRLDPLIYAALWSGGLRENWSPFQIRPEHDALSITAPVLLVHGTEDGLFPLSQGERIFRNLSSPEKQWLPIPGGKHHALAQSYGPGYGERIFSFLEQHLSPATLKKTDLASRHF